MTIISSATGKIAPLPSMGTPVERAARSWAGYDAMIAAAWSGV